MLKSVRDSLILDMRREINENEAIYRQKITDFANQNNKLINKLIRLHADYAFLMYVVKVEDQ